MNKLLLSTLLALASVAQASVVVNFDGTTNNLVTTNINVSALPVLITSAGNPDIVRSSVAYGTTIATNGVGTYTGPTAKAGVYMNALYNEGTATIGTATGWFQIINNIGTPAQDFIQIRRNNNSGTIGTINATSTTRGVFTFDTGGSFKLDGTSAFSLTGGINITTGEVAHWVVVNGGTTYISQTSIDFTSTGNTTVYSFTDPDATNWAAWTPNSDLSNIPGSFTTAGTSLTAITEAGFFFEKVGRTDLNPTFRVFTADLAAIPEPSSLALIGLALGTLLLFRRRA